MTKLEKRIMSIQVWKIKKNSDKTIKNWVTNKFSHNKVKVDEHLKDLRIDDD